MGNLVSADIEGGFNRFCEELVANDPKHKSGCFHWASPPLKKEQLEHFKGCLSKNNCLKRLVLQDLDALEDGASLAQVIQNHPALTCLAFHGRLPKDGFEAFAQAFLQSPTLTELEIQNSIVPDNIVDGVVAILQKQQDGANGKITSLSLKGCQIDQTGLDRFTKALEESKVATAATLKTLEITLKPPIVALESAKNLSAFFQAKHSVLEDVKCAGFLQNALPELLAGAKGHAHLRRLTHEGVGLNNGDSMKSISQLLQDAPSLSVLDLSTCNLNGTCGAQLAETLASNKAAGLKELYLAHNQLSSEGTIALSKALQATDSPFRENLEVLDLRRNGIGTEGIVALAKALQTNPPAFQQLHIGDESIRSHRTIDGEDITALAEMIRGNKTLQRLYIEDASFQDEGIAKLLGALEANTTIKQLHLSCFTTKSLQAVMSSIPTTHLQKIRIRVQGEAQLNEVTARCLKQALGKTTTLREIKLTDLKGPNAAVWKAIEPKIHAFLSRHNGENGINNKRSLAPPANGGSEAKRVKCE